MGLPVMWQVHFAKRENDEVDLVAFMFASRDESEHGVA